jgi:rhodanese-related sulfurtransferase
MNERISAVTIPLLTATTAALIVFFAIYLTPLKHVALIEPTIDDISAEAFYEMYRGNEDKYIFIDVRGESAYERIHAEGSENMPLHTLYNERVNLPKSGKEIVLICSGGIASGVGYHYLEHFGHFNIKRVGGGIEAWVDAGLPVITSI